MKLSQLSMVPLTKLKGVGDSRALLFFKRGITNVRDLLEYYPRDYLDESRRTAISDIQPDAEVLIRARLICDAKNVHVRSLTITNARIADETGEMNVVWYNQPYMMRNLKAGEVYFFSGKVKASRAGRLSLSSPRVRKAEQELPGIVPVYPLGGGLTQNMVFQAVSRALELLEEEDPLPASYRQNLPLLSEAIRGMHRPKSFDEIEQSRHRLVLEELLVQQAALRTMKRRHDDGETGEVLVGDKDQIQAFTKALPYTPTGAQLRSFAEISDDLSGRKAMNRLLQGDVGSGKTLVAFLSVYQAYLSGFQSALMAPTEVLARQHAQSAKKMLGPYGVKTELLTGSVKGKERERVLEELKNGQIDLVVGTHALISENVEYGNLGLVITDEQHRFGVRQRLKLSEKGRMPNVLVMTATPIPRTLALILYGDMDVSLLDEMPPGRTPVKTYKVDRRYEERLYAFMRRQVEEGHQVYIICALVDEKDAETVEQDGPETAGKEKDGEEQEKVPLIAATDYAAFLQKEVFPDLSVGLLHGKMKPQQKDEVMKSFASGKTQILVSTTVVEVGVDVPNATLMVIENAERFGLAQLHQLRGRVGRGTSTSYCVLVSDVKSQQTRKRLKTLVDSNDGFYIAEEDLRLRGAGDVFGLRQHGLPEFRIADLYRDTDILKQAQSLADTIMEADPDLRLLEHRGLKEEMEAFWQRAAAQSQS